VFEALMLLTYETPRWLFGKNKDYLGIKVLKIIRGPDAQIMREIDRIKTALRRTYSVMDQLREFRLPSVYRPFILTIMLMVFQQFSGINAAIFYSSNIFGDAGYKGNLSEIISAAAVGITQIIATTASVLLVDRLGRRILLVASSTGMGGSSLVLAVFFYFKDSNHCTSESCKQHLGFMAIAAIVVFIASFSVGWGPIPWTSMSELLPNRVRGLAASIAAVVNWTCATAITLGFNYYAKGVTPKIAWASFGFVMVLSVVCVILFLPETKGRSLEEIQEDFEQGNIFAIRCRKRRNRNKSSPDTSQTSGIN
jgi:MFS family permease